MCIRTDERNKSHAEKDLVILSLDLHILSACSVQSTRAKVKKFICLFPRSNLPFHMPPYISKVLFAILDRDDFIKNKSLITFSSCSKYLCVIYSLNKILQFSVNEEEFYDCVFPGEKLIFFDMSK